MPLAAIKWSNYLSNLPLYDNPIVFSVHFGKILLVFQNDRFKDIS